MDFGLPDAGERAMDLLVFAMIFLVIIIIMEGPGGADAAYPVPGRDVPVGLHVLRSSRREGRKERGGGTE